MIHKQNPIIHKIEFFSKLAKKYETKSVVLIVLFLKAAGNGVTYINLRVLSF